SCPRPGNPGIAALREALRVCGGRVSGKACGHLGMNVWITVVCGGMVGAERWWCGGMTSGVGAAWEGVSAGHVEVSAAHVGVGRPAGGVLVARGVWHGANCCRHGWRSLGAGGVMDEE